MEIHSGSERTDINKHIDYLHSRHLHALDLRRQGRLQEAREVLQEVAIARRDLNLHAEAAETAMLLGTLASEQKDYREAVAWFDFILALPLSGDDETRRSDALEALADMYASLGDYVNALNYYLQCLAGREEEQNFNGVGRMLHAVGVVYGITGDYDAAHDYLQRSLTLFHELGAHYMEVKAMLNLAGVLQARNDLDGGLDYALRALTIYDALDDHTGAAATMVTVGEIYERKNRPDVALSFLLRASELLKKEEENELYVTTLLNVGRLYRESGEPEGARFVLEQGLAIVDEGNLRLRYRLHDGLSRTLELLNDVRGALEHLRKSGVLRSAFLDEEKGRAVAELQMRFDLERSLKEEELRRRNDVVNAVIETQEAERRRIARDLHDGVGQLLAAVRLNLMRMDDAAHRLPREGAEGYRRAVELLEQVGGDVRTIAHALGSSTLRELGIVAALRELVDDADRSEAVSFAFDVHGDEERLEEGIELGLYRIAQELITNVMKHSRASEASIQLVRHLDRMVLMVEDDGIGFNVADVRRGMGTRNVEARIRMLSGTVRFDSRPGHGTTVTVEIPLPR